MDLASMAFSGGWAAGVNAYGTVFLLGLFGRLGLGDVPEILMNPGVMAAAGVLFAIEAVVDKVPYLDSTWDLLHTFVRPVVGGGLGAAFTGDSGTLDQAVAATGAGSTALASHAVKASLRLVVNTSPEPLSTIIVSTLEDLAMAGVVALIVTHPLEAAGVAAILLTTGVVLVLAIRRRIRRALDAWRRRREARSGGPEPQSSNSA